MDILFMVAGLTAGMSNLFSPNMEHLNTRMNLFTTAPTPQDKFNALPQLLHEVANILPNIAARQEILHSLTNHHPTRRIIVTKDLANYIHEQPVPHCIKTVMQNIAAVIEQETEQTYTNAQSADTDIAMAALKSPFANTGTILKAVENDNIDVNIHALKMPQENMSIADHFAQYKAQKYYFSNPEVISDLIANLNTAGVALCALGQSARMRNSGGQLLMTADLLTNYCDAFYNLELQAYHAAQNPQ
jgi:hypothetical protein